MSQSAELTTALNTPAGYFDKVCSEICGLIKRDFIPAFKKTNDWRTLCSAHKTPVNSAPEGGDC